MIELSGGPDQNNLHGLLRTSNLCFEPKNVFEVTKTVENGLSTS
jgi:hypothetical protein